MSSENIKHNIKEEASEYSLMVESELFDTLTNDQKVMWKKETEQHFINGFIRCMEMLSENKK